MIADPDVATLNVRKVAGGRRFALARNHPRLEGVDFEEFFLAWRDGVAWAWTSSAKLSSMLATAAETIILLGQAHDAAAPLSVCPHCGSRLTD